MNLLIKKIWDIVNISIVTYSWLLKNNANREIKKAEKIIADFQVSRMMGKAGSSNDKSILNSKTSGAFNSYIVNTTSYNTQDAMLSAHALQVADTKKRMEFCMLLQMVMNCVLLVLSGQMYKIPFVVAGSIVTIVADIKTKQVAMHTINVLTSNGFISLILECLYVVVAAYDMVPNTLKNVHAYVYAGLSSLVTLIF